MRSGTKDLLVGAIVLSVAGSAAALGFFYATGKSERDCQEFHRQTFAEALSRHIQRGDTRPEVRRFLKSHEWDFSETPKSAPNQLLAGRFTYCGLGSSLMIHATFEFDERDRLTAYELDDGTPPALRVER